MTTSVLEVAAAKQWRSPALGIYAPISNTARSLIMNGEPLSEVAASPFRPMSLSGAVSTSNADIAALRQTLGGGNEVPIGRKRTVIQPSEPDGPATKVFDRLVALKVATASIAMHLEQAWRGGLFQSLDRLLDESEWDFSDEMPSDMSYLTFLRMIIHLRINSRPALGATTDGRIIAAWLRGPDRLQIECGENDMVKWVLSIGNGDERESAAGHTSVSRLPQVLAAYRPERWFVSGN